MKLELLRIRTYFENSPDLRFMWRLWGLTNIENRNINRFEKYEFVNLGPTLGLFWHIESIF